MVVLFALAAGGEREALARHAAAVLWLAVLLAGLLALDSLFRGDAEDGSLEQWLLAPVPLPWLVAVRVFATGSRPRCRCWSRCRCWGELLSPAARAQLPVLMLSLLLGTPLLGLLGAVVAAPDLGMRRAGILVALLALPL